jgi:hypothetical protein
MKETLEEAIVLLNDGEISNEEGHCNSWPGPSQHPIMYIDPPSCPLG